MVIRETAETNHHVPHCRSCIRDLCFFLANLNPAEKVLGSGELPSLSTRSPGWADGSWRLVFLVFRDGGRPGE